MQKKKIMLLIFFSALLINCFQTTRDTFDVGTTFFEFHDKQQDRILLTELWYPIDSAVSMEYTYNLGYFKQLKTQKDAPLSTHKKRYPLILFSHGYGGDRWGNSWIAEYLAQHGFIVAAMDHYGNNWYNMMLNWSIKPFIRAKDISFVLTQLLQNPFWGEKIDTNAIGVIGFSQGGAAALLLAGATLHITNVENDLGPTLSPEFKEQLPTFLIKHPFDYEEAQTSFFDPRIKRAVAMAPGFGGENRTFTEQSLLNAQIPVLILAGEADRINPIYSNAQFYASNIHNAKLIILPGDISHWIFMNELNPLGKKEAPHFGVDDTYVNRQEYHTLIGNAVVDFFSNM